MPTISLISDFGLQEPLPAIAKTMVLKQVGDCNFIDISHHLDPFNLLQAAYIFRAAFPHFPEGTCHLLLCSLFLKPGRTILFAQYKNQWLIGVDNGLFPFLFDSPIKIYGTSLPEQLSNNTQHTIQHIAFIAGELLKGTPIDHLGTIVEPGIVQQLFQPTIYDNGIEGQVIHIDNFHNVIVNITRHQFENQRKGRNFRIEFMRKDVIKNISSNYSEVAPGSPLCLFNNAGFLEIAINQGAAAKLFGFEKTNNRNLIYNTVKVIFE
jgi:S-adenosylmethionine hydrolase